MSRAMTYLSTAHLCTTAAERWRLRYGPKPHCFEEWASHSHEEKYRQVLALGEHPLPDAVAAILGESWVRTRCQLCHRSVDTAVQLSAYDTSMEICLPCLDAARLLSQAQPAWHPSADIAPNASIGAGTRIWAFSVICPDVVIGEGCVVGSHACIAPRARLGDQVRLQSHCFVCEDAVVGSRVFFGVGVVMSADKYPRVGKTDYVPNPPIIEDDVNIGSGAVLLPGVRLGQGCTIGAGAVVTHDVPAGETWIGSPAKSITYIRASLQDATMDWSLYRSVTAQKSEHEGRP